MNRIPFHSQMMRRFVAGELTHVFDISRQQPKGFIDHLSGGYWMDGDMQVLWPPYKVGDRFFIAEGWKKQQGKLLYRVDHPDLDIKWRSPLDMPVGAERYVVEVTAVRGAMVGALRAMDRSTLLYGEHGWCAYSAYESIWMWAMGIKELTSLG